MIVELRTTVFYRPTEKGETGYFNVGRTHMTMLDPTTGMNFILWNGGYWTCPRIVTITDGDVPICRLEWDRQFEKLDRTTVEDIYRSAGWTVEP